MSKNSQIIAVVVLGLLLLPGAISSLSNLWAERAVNASVRAHVNDGLAALDAKSIDVAQIAFQSALELDRTDPTARKGLDRVRALRVTTQASSTSRGDAIAMRYRFEKALKKDPSNAEVYQLALGTVSSALRDEKAARGWYEKATSPKGASSQAWAARGAFDLGLGKLDDAAKSLQTALKLDTENAGARSA